MKNYQNQFFFKTMKCNIIIILISLLVASCGNKDTDLWQLELDEDGSYCLTYGVDGMAPAIVKSKSSVSDTIISRIQIFIDDDHTPYVSFGFLYDGVDNRDIYPNELGIIIDDKNNWYKIANIRTVDSSNGFISIVLNAEESKTIIRYFHEGCDQRLPGGSSSMLFLTKSLSFNIQIISLIGFKEKYKEFIDKNSKIGEFNEYTGRFEK